MCWMNSSCASTIIAPGDLSAVSLPDNPSIRPLPA
jgi:hypothetical protein